MWIALIILLVIGIIAANRRTPSKDVVKASPHSEKKEPTSARETKDYVGKNHLLSAAELNLFRVLKSVLTNEHMLFAKVRQADILESAYKKNSGNFWYSFNKISQKHVDFLICDSETSRPLIIIELNDKSHQRADRIERDEHLRKSLKLTHIKLIEIKAESFYQVNSIKNLIYENLSFADKQQSTGVTQKDSHKNSEKQFSPLQPNDKCNHADMDTKMQPKKWEHNLFHSPEKISSLHHDSKYMPKN